MTTLLGRTALVTGAGSGIGRAIALRLAAAGAELIVVDRNADGAAGTVDQIVGLGGTAEALTLDLTDRAAIASVLGGLAGRRRIDVLVNNAGIIGSGKQALDVPDETWDAVLAINLSAVLFVTQAVLPSMLQRGTGVVINMASASATLASPAGIEYTAAKHGVVGLTKQLAFEYGHSGVRILAVAPGVIAGTNLSGGSGISSGQYEELTMQAPAGRYGTPEEVANVVTFLAGDEASFIHGVAVPVDGGSTIY